jgi:hypothetical protein
VSCSQAENHIIILVREEVDGISHTSHAAMARKLKYHPHTPIPIFSVFKYRNLNIKHSKPQISSQWIY